MKRKSLIITILTITTTLLMGILLSGCSRSITDWATRGSEGLENARENVTQWYKTARENLQQKKKYLVEDTFDEIRLARAGALYSIPALTTTQPSSKDNPPKKIELTDLWLINTFKGMQATLSLLEIEGRQLDQRYAAEMRNLAGTQEAFDQIKELNKAYIGMNNSLSAQISKLSSEISQIKND